MADRAAIKFDSEALAALCRRWKIRELSLFGSAARGEMGPESDVDLLVSFEPAATWGLLDHESLREELEELFGRRVDLVTRAQITRSHNWIRRQSILESATPLHVA